MNSVFLLIFHLLWLGILAQDADNISEPLSTYISRPDLRPIALNVSIQNSDHEHGYIPGYIFICPYRANQTGPYIYDKRGNLVWSGYNFSEAELDVEINTHELHPCEYQGVSHLCMWKGTQQSGSGEGQGLIMNENYEIVQYVQTGNNAPPNDFHESRVINGGDSALLSIYNSIEYDLLAYNITAEPQWLVEGMFQEVNISTGEVLFEWHSSKHVDLSASYVQPGESEVAGNGTTNSSGWDYFHINAIDKSPRTGNYIISARHVSAIYYIDASNGSVIWTLSYGNPNNTFHFDNFNFTFQHHVRIREENDTHTVISIFDNASNDFNKTASESSGMVIALDHEAETATLINRTFAPKPAGILAGSQANYQLLDNGGTFIGWGSVPAVSETNAAGEPVFYAEFGSWVYNYRAYTGNWTGRPLDSPALVAPAQAENATTPLVTYFSWNGATDVHQWRLWGSLNSSVGFEELDTIDKQGFETSWMSTMYTPFIYVEALSEDGKALGNSTVVGVNRIRPNGTVVEPTSVPVNITHNPSPTSTSTSTGTNGPRPSETSDAPRKGTYGIVPALLMGGIAMLFLTLA